MTINASIPLAGRHHDMYGSFQQGVKNNVGRQSAQNSLVMQENQIKQIPQQNKLLDYQVQGAQQGIESNDQKLALNEQLKGIRDEAIEAHRYRGIIGTNPELAARLLQSRIDRLGSEGDDVSYEQGILEALRKGDFKGATAYLDDVIDLGERTKVLAAKKSDLGLKEILAMQLMEQRGAKAGREAEAHEAKMDAAALKLEADELEKQEAATKKEKEKYQARVQSATALSRLNELLQDDLYTKAYGGYGASAIGKAIPFVRQQILDADIMVDNVVALLTVDAREKLEGQGQITEGETAMLGRSETILTNKGLSEERAEQEILRVRAIYENALRRAKGEKVPEITEDMVFTNPFGKKAIRGQAGRRDVDARGRPQQPYLPQQAPAPLNLPNNPAQPQQAAPVQQGGSERLNLPNGGRVAPVQGAQLMQDAQGNLAWKLPNGQFVETQ